MKKSYWPKLHINSNIVDLLVGTRLLLLGITDAKSYFYTWQKRIVVWLAVGAVVGAWMGGISGMLWGAFGGVGHAHIYAVFQHHPADGHGASGGAASRHRMGAVLHVAFVLTAVRLKGAIRHFKRTGYTEMTFRGQQEMREVFHLICYYIDSVIHNQPGAKNERRN